MTAPRSRLLAAAAATAALLPVGCAQENPKLIPRADAEALIASVDEVGAAVADDECARATEELANARTQVDGLPREVAQPLTNRLRQGLEHLEAQIPVDCQSQPEEVETPEVTPEPTAAPEATPTPEPPAETTTPTPDETPTPEVEPNGDDGVSGGEEVPAE